MKNKLFILIFLLSITVNVGVLITLGYHTIASNKKLSTHCINKSMMILCSELALSGEQKKIICAKQEEIEVKIKKIRKDIFKHKTELLNLISEHKPDEIKIQSKITEVTLLQAKIQGIVIKNLIQSKEALTPDQQRKLLSLVSERMCPGNFLKDK